MFGGDREGAVDVELSAFPSPPCDWVYTGGKSWSLSQVSEGCSCYACIRTVSVTSARSLSCAGFTGTLSGTAGGTLWSTIMMEA